MISHLKATSIVDPNARSWVGDGNYCHYDQNGVYCCTDDSSEYDEWGSKNATMVGFNEHYDFVCPYSHNSFFTGATEAVKKFFTTMNIIIVSASGAGLLIILIICSCCCCKKKKNTSKTGTVSTNLVLIIYLLYLLRYQSASTEARIKLGFTVTINTNYIILYTFIP